MPRNPEVDMSDFTPEEIAALKRVSPFREFRPNINSEFEEDPEKIDQLADQLYYATQLVITLLYTDPDTSISKLPAVEIRKRTFKNTPWGQLSLEIQDSFATEKTEVTIATFENRKTKTNEDEIRIFEAVLQFPTPNITIIDGPTSYIEYTNDSASFTPDAGKLINKTFAILEYYGEQRNILEK